MACYQLAWKSFAKWWIPLCLISAGILVFKLGPKLVTGDSQKNMVNGTIATFKAMAEGDEWAAQSHSSQLRQDAQTFARDLLRYTGIALPFVAVLWSVLLLYANRAVKDRKKKQPVLRVLLVAVWRMALAALKLLPLLLAAVYVVILQARDAGIEDVRWGLLAALMLISPFWFVVSYIKLLFVPLVMFDGETGGFAACRRSWHQTKGHFGMLFLIVIINSFVQAALAVTIIGAIPGLSFVETVRAAAFRMTLPEGEGVATGDEEIAQEGDPSAEGDAS